MFPNTQRTLNIYFQLLIANCIILLCSPRDIVFNTKFTNCSIVFSGDKNSDSNNDMRLVSCTRRMCLRNLLNSDCANLQ